MYVIVIKYNIKCKLLFNLKLITTLIYRPQVYYGIDHYYIMIPIKLIVKYHWFYFIIRITLLTTNFSSEGHSFIYYNKIIILYRTISYGNSLIIEFYQHWNILFL